MNDNNDEHRPSQEGARPVPEAPLANPVLDNTLDDFLPGGTGSPLREIQLKTPPLSLIILNAEQLVIEDTNERIWSLQRRDGAIWAVEVEVTVLPAETRKKVEHFNKELGKGGSPPKKKFIVAVGSTDILCYVKHNSSWSEVKPKKEGA